MIGTIIDIAIAVIALIAFIVGIAKGFVKQLTGLLSGIMSLILAVVLTALVANWVCGTDLFASFQGTAAGWFKKELFTTEVVSQEELLGVMVSAGGFWGILKGLAPSFYVAMETNGYTTLGQLLGLYVAKLIAYVAIWLVLFIVLKLLFKGLGKVLGKIASVPVIKTIDRLLGAVWSLAFTYVIVIGVLLTGVEIVVSKYISGSWEALCGILSQSKLLTIANNTNFIGAFLAEFLQVTLPTL